MSLLGDRSASFIVRIWREQGAQDSAFTEWRGSIEHVGSSDRLFFRELKAMTEFLKRHLAEIGVDVEQRFWEMIETAAERDAPSEPGRKSRPKR
jgi:hypothetical protein